MHLADGFSEGEHPQAGTFLPAETQLKHQNQKFDQKFDFEERGYFGITKKPQEKKDLKCLKRGWSAAEARLKRGLHLEKSDFFRKEVWI